MKINGYESDKAVLKEIGERIKAYRIISNLSQEEFAEKCNLSLSTVIRIESGSDTKLSNLIKILRFFDILTNTDLLIPEKQQDFEVIFHNRKTKQRATKKIYRDNNFWKWGDEQ